jgi:hypothetical protein
MNTLNSKTVLAVMVSLGERFSRETSTPLVRMYHQALEPHLTNDELNAGTRIVIAEDTFFPSPARLIEAATSSIDDQAAANWSELLAANREDRKHAADQIARESLANLGGGQILKSMTGDAVLRIRAAFLTEYARRARAIRIKTYAALPEVIA